MTSYVGEQGYINYEWFGLDGLADLVDRVTRSYELAGPLAEVLKEMFEETQARVHSPMNPGSPNYVPTGSLQASGTTETEMTELFWEGTITYGGSSGGFPNDPVDYAIYEMARGGLHDFFGGLEALADERVEHVIDSFFEQATRG